MIFGTVATGVSGFAVGNPDNRHSWVDSSGRSWVFITDGTTLKCFFTSDGCLVSWQESSTAVGGGAALEVGNNGRAFTVAFGSRAGVEYAYVVHKTGPLISDESRLVRYELTDTGLANAIDVSIGQSGADTRGFSIRFDDYSNVSTLWLNTMDIQSTSGSEGARSATQQWNWDLTGQVGGGAVVYDDGGADPKGLFEVSDVYPLADGYMLFGMSIGDSNAADNDEVYAVEYYKTGLADFSTGNAWSAVNVIDDDGATTGLFEGSHYGSDPDVSHFGKVDAEQISNGSIGCCYIKNTDQAGGNDFGDAVFLTRGNTIADAWTVRDLDLFGEGVAHLCVTTDGSKWIVFAAAYDGSTGYDGRILRVDVDGTTFAKTAPAVVHTVPAGNFRRMAAAPYSNGGPLLVYYSDDSTVRSLSFSTLTVCNLMKRLLDRGEVELGEEISFNFTTNDSNGNRTDGDSAPTISKIFKTTPGSAKAELSAADVTAAALSISQAQDTTPANLTGEWTCVQTAAGAAAGLFADEDEVEVEISHVISGETITYGFNLQYKAEFEPKPFMT